MWVFDLDQDWIDKRHFPIGEAVPPVDQASRTRYGERKHLQQDSVGDGPRLHVGAQA